MELFLPSDFCKQVVLAKQIQCTCATGYKSRTECLLLWWRKSIKIKIAVLA